MSLQRELVKLKDLSELMIELAYSALFLHDKTFSRQVHILYKEFKEIHDFFQKRMKKRSRDQDEWVYLSRLSSYLKEFAINAVFLADLSELNHPPKAVKEAFITSDRRIIEELVHFSSFFVGKTLGVLNLRVHTKTRLLAIKRDDKWLFDLPDTLAIKAKDILIAVGVERSAKLLKELVNQSAIG